MIWIFCDYFQLSAVIYCFFVLLFCLKNMSLPEIQWWEQSAQPSISLCDWHIWNSSSLTFLSCHCGVPPCSHSHSTEFAYLQEVQIIAKEGARKREHWGMRVLGGGSVRSFKSHLSSFSQHDCVHIINVVLNTISNNNMTDCHIGWY